MKFYRVRLHHDHHVSGGYIWTTSMAEANAEGKKWKEQINEDEVTPFEIETVEIEPTKHGILEALNRYASHEQNG